VVRFGDRNCIARINQLEAAKLPEAWVIPAILLPTYKTWERRSLLVSFPHRPHGHRRGTPRSFPLSTSPTYLQLYKQHTARLSSSSSSPSLPRPYRLLPHWRHKEDPCFDLEWEQPISSIVSPRDLVIPSHTPFLSSVHLTLLSPKAASRVRRD